MGNTRSSEHSSIDWLAKGPLAPHIDAYMLYLANRDCAATTFSSISAVLTSLHNGYTVADYACKASTKHW